MEKKCFNHVIKAYSSILERCENLMKISSGGFDDLTVREFRELITEAQDLQSKSDLILTNELYHLIGMGNLTAVQTSELCKIIKKIGNSRSYIKPIASYLLEKLPTVPDKSDYKCKVADIKLTSVFKEEKK